MHIEFLVEEPSAEAALHNIVPKIIGPGNTYDIHTYEGKFDLLKKLPNRLRGYRSWLPSGWIIVILIDEDNKGCQLVKRQLEDIALKENLYTKSNKGINGSFQVINRLAIQELEAWFFGDPIALRNAYPKVPKGLDRNKKYRNPDAIEKPSKALGQVLQRVGYHRAGLPKKEAARRISGYMDPMRNSSKSFQVFRDTLNQVC
ncbi:MAG: DUF4276 family protein [Deltaproteobacteria bacterium]|nr:DUF4276 family protein [Deltaproteobacteria bacterium]MBM4295016.1 DUF4276 family protein [Deltaproteobacteria bacterium]